MWFERPAAHLLYICSLYVHITTYIPPTPNSPLPTSNSPLPPPPGDIIRVMKNSITWFDHLRSRLTGQPAKVYCHSPPGRRPTCIASRSKACPHAVATAQRRHRTHRPIRQSTRTIHGWRTDSSLPSAPSSIGVLRQKPPFGLDRARSSASFAAGPGSICDVNPFCRGLPRTAHRFPHPAGVWMAGSGCRVECGG